MQLRTTVKTLVEEATYDDQFDISCNKDIIVFTVDRVVYWKIIEEFSQSDDLLTDLLRDEFQ